MLKLFQKIACISGLLLIIMQPAISPAHTHHVLLSEKEAKWLNEKRSLRLGVGVAFPPFMWVEKKNDKSEFKGIVSDYVNLLSKRLNVDMEIVFDISFKEALARGQDGRIDFFPCLSNTPERSKFLLFTEPYLKYPIVIITREDAPIIGGIEDLRGKKIAIVKHLVVYSKLKNDYPELNLNYVFTQKVEENLEAVSLDRADACIINLAAASYYIQKKGLTNLRIAAPINWDGVQLAMGFRKDWPILQGIMAKGLASISQAEKDEISQRWIRVKYDPGVDIGIIWRWALGIGAGISILFLLVLAWNRSLQKEIAGRKDAEKNLEKTIDDLQTALDEVKTLQGLIPICASCKKIRDDKGYWNQIESYIQKHSKAQFSHGICPDCSEKIYGDNSWYKEVKNEED